MLIFALGAAAAGWLAGESLRRRRRVGDSILGSGHRLGQYEYESEEDFAKAQAAYDEVTRNRTATEEEIAKAYAAYKKAYEEYQDFLSLRGRLEQYAKAQDRDLFDLWSTQIPQTKEDLERRMEDRLAKMEELWPGWYKRYLDWQVFLRTGGKPDWYLTLEEAAGSVLNLALQLVPFFQGMRGAVRGGVRLPRPSMPGGPPVVTRTIAPPRSIGPELIHESRVPKVIRDTIARMHRESPRPGQETPAGVYRHPETEELYFYPELLKDAARVFEQQTGRPAPLPQWIKDIPDVSKVVREAIQSATPAQKAALQKWQGIISRPPTPTRDPFRPIPEGIYPLQPSFKPSIVEKVWQEAHPGRLIYPGPSPAGEAPIYPVPRPGGPGWKWTTSPQSRVIPSGIPTPGSISEGMARLPMPTVPGRPTVSVPFTPTGGGMAFTGV